MFKYFDKLVKKLSWIDIKLVGLIGICFGVLLAKLLCVSCIPWQGIVALIILCYFKIIYSLFLKK